MLIVCVSLCLAVVIVYSSIRMKKPEATYDTTNTELIKYFNDFYYSPNAEKRTQLLRAAKYLLEYSDVLREYQSSAETLYDQGVLSESYIKKVNLKLENEFFIEKGLIIREAESLKAGYGEYVFSEANGLPGIFRKKEGYKNRVDWKKSGIKREIINELK